MCGILGVVINRPSDQIKENLMKIYANQKHRGSHGCGIAKMSYRSTMTRRRGVNSDALFQQDFNNFYENLQHRDRLILHHRFASHGGSGDVLESNHPFIDENFNTALIHNGVIGNYDTIYKKLISENHIFESELRLITKKNQVIQQQITDSEVILHLIDQNPIQQADELAQLQGSCAIAVVNKQTRGILLYRWNNPIIVSTDEIGNYYFSSEFKNISGLTEVEVLQEGVLYRLSIDGIERLKVIRKPTPVVVTAKSYANKGKNATFSDYKINKLGYWEKNKPDFDDIQWYE